MSLALGVVENMSAHICSNCGIMLSQFFGTGGAEKLAEKYHTKLLGRVPLHISLREDLDRGQPTVMRDPEGEFADIYREIASGISALMYWEGIKSQQRFLSVPIGYEKRLFSFTR